LIGDPGLQPIQPVFQQPEDLVLGVVATKLPDNLFTVIQKKTLQLGRWRIHFHIIGESHWIRIEHDDRLALQEVLACTTLNKAWCSHHHEFADLAGHQHMRDNYGVSIQFSHRHGWIEPALSNDTQMEARFPEMFGWVPITRVRWRVVGQRVSWWTLHIYPEPNRVTYVKTQSHFSCD
jgi:hypothetical protein